MTNYGLEIAENEETQLSEDWKETWTKDKTMKPRQKYIPDAEKRKVLFNFNYALTSGGKKRAATNSDFTIIFL